MCAALIAGALTLCSSGPMTCLRVCPVVFTLCSLPGHSCIDFYARTCFRTLRNHCLKPIFALLMAVVSCRVTVEFLLMSMGERYSSLEPKYDCSINHGSYSAGVLCVVTDWSVPVVFVTLLDRRSSPSTVAVQEILIWTPFYVRSTHSVLSILPRGGGREGPTCRTLLDIRIRSERGAPAGLSIFICDANVRLKRLDPKKCIRQGKIGSPVCARACGLLRWDCMASPQHVFVLIPFPSLAWSAEHSRR